MSQGEDGIVPGGDEFLGDVTGVTSFEDLAHDGWVIDFLSVIDFSTAWISSSVIVGDVLMVITDAPDDVTVHDRDMINVEE